MSEQEDKTKSSVASQATFPILESVRERDVDLLILEELYAKTGFETLFLKIIDKQDFSFVKAYRSMTTAGLGETDIQAEFIFGQKQLILLIENKVDAEFQNAQYERYMKRAELLTNPSTETAVILVAPQDYIQNKSEFQYALSYEDMLAWFSQQGDARSWYKQELLRLAIEQERRGYQAIKDETVTNFWKRYHAYISDHLPELNMPEPKAKPTASSFVYFNPSWIQKSTKLIHKMEKGYLDFQLSNRAPEYDDLLKQYSDILPEYMELVVTGKSVSFRIEVAPLSFDKEFDEQINNLSQLVDAVFLIKEFILKHLS